MAFVSGCGGLGVPGGRAAVCSRETSFGGQAVVAVPVGQRAQMPVAPVLPTMPTIEAMRHRKRGRKLNKPADQRKALLRALTTELIRHGRISSTLARCKEVRRCADHMIQLSKDGSLHARRQAMGFIYDKQLVHALFEQGAERYRERQGGYTRVLRTMPRKGDNAEMGIIELV
ncbi:hypothetical protein NDN08_003099 [Rhodosorus marinus]|uniref:Large ribosomal subunit protein bL17c n=1 Tax=Rhodosorus marinus TaxID=101924 RepID=A0AAV8UVJ2_9RHOD|nr:hypothetical protein NDN08_003099 [Rhodosorus marinus]